MKKIALLVVIGIIVLSCSNKEIELQGDLYFKLIDIGSFYGADDQSIEKFERSLDSLQRINALDEDELEFIRVLDALKANDLIKAPWINLKTETDIERIYLSEKEYEKLKGFDRNELISNDKKVELKIVVVEIDSGIYYSDKIAEINLIDGKTYWRK